MKYYFIYNLQYLHDPLILFDDGSCKWGSKKWDSRMEFSINFKIIFGYTPEFIESHE